ncbi:hypothetical protein BDY19DRAFT_410801 [Irpex rosettiformis]|uniref:Uncharacterized protein n=1 Tax=Irpex rosettiformis TaxID=378272 RepID=A0ACB8UGH8_9APHY|nr:hypothetical protein BDY19DRAFT_410801 [Irpex rosettiformis]
MEVSGGNTPQPLGDGGVPSEQPHSDPSRRGSSGSLHEQQAFANTYAAQDVYDPNLQHDGFNSNDQSSYTHTPPQPEQYVTDNGSYSPSSTISARSQNVANGKGVNEHSHSVSPSMPQHSSSSELIYALHHSTPAENINSSELTYPTEYDSSLANSSENHLSPHQAHAQYDSLSSKSDQFASHSYAQQTDTYDMPHSHVQSGYSPPHMDYTYQMYQDPSLYNNGAVEIGSMCVPAMMDGMHMSDYLAS